MSHWEEDTLHTPDALVLIYCANNLQDKKKKNQTADWTWVHKMQIIWFEKKDPFILQSIFPELSCCKQTHHAIKHQAITVAVWNDVVDSNINTTVGDKLGTRSTQTNKQNNNLKGNILQNITNQFEMNSPTAILKRLRNRLWSSFSSLIRRRNSYSLPLVRAYPKPSQCPLKTFLFLYFSVFLLQIHGKSLARDLIQRIWKIWTFPVLVLFIPVPGKGPGVCPGAFSKVQARPRTRWRDYVSRLVLAVPRGPPGGAWKEAWNTLLNLPLT